MLAERCSFTYDHPRSARRLSTACQFTNELANYACDGRPYCRFHLPLRDCSGTRTEKLCWDDSERNRFYRDVNIFISAEKEAKRLVNFTGVSFPGKAFFEGQRFQETVWCDATFDDTVSFLGTFFKGEAHFKDATFGGSAYFDQVEFSDDANFRSASFLATVSFRDAKFLMDAHFNDSLLTQRSDFTNAEFASHAIFTGSRFHDRVDFVEVLFSKVTIFDDALFRDMVRFDNTQFMSVTAFTNTVFLSDVSFNWLDSKRHSETTPSNENTGDFRYLDFSGGSVAGVVDFSNRKFQNTTDFRERLFEAPPKFHNAGFHQETKWRGAVFLGTEQEDAEQDYRTLRLAMDATKNRPQEGIFFALEQKAMRHQAKWWELKAIASHLYDLSCGYGQSASRPLAWLAGVTLVFGLFYLAASGVRWVDWAFASDLTSFTLRHVVKPFTVWGREIDELIAPFHGGLSIWVKLLATLQSLISLGLFALFLLALRWQFRRA